MAAAGTILFTSAVSLAVSILGPFSSMTLGTTYGSCATRDSGIRTNAPPAASAGVPDSVPATRTRTGAPPSSGVSVTVLPRRSPRAACGEASTPFPVSRPGTTAGQVRDDATSAE